MRARTVMSKAVPGLFLVLSCGAAEAAQVHYHADGNPWKQRARKGPDAEVEGWFYNLGVTGLRVELVEEEKTALVVRHVFADSPAHRRVEAGDRIVGAHGARFETPHRNGYGMEVFGPRGPIEDFATALERATEDRVLPLILRRGEDELEVKLKLPRGFAVAAPSFPDDARSRAEHERLCDWLVAQQREDGSWGSPPEDTFAPLALLASDKAKHRKAVLMSARFHAGNTDDEGAGGGLVNWRYMAAGIVLSEVYLATGERWILKELEEVRDFLMKSQYVELSQVNPKVRESHPDAWPRDELDSHGGWGHNPGFEGYGPICMLTGQGALALSLMHHCGLEIDRERHLAAYAFLERGTGRNGYVWYEDQAAGQDDWADMGRTGAAGIANSLAPYDDAVFAKRALAHARVIGSHPESFPDTHGSPILGMGFAALAANTDPASFERLMARNRWWFTLSECTDGTYYYQPNRDNAGYGADSRLSATAVTAFIFAIPTRRLHVFGKPFED